MTTASDPASLRAETRRAIEKLSEALTWQPDPVIANAWSAVEQAIEAEIAARVPRWEPLSTAPRHGNYARVSVEEGLLYCPGGGEASLWMPLSLPVEATTTCLNDPPRTRESAALALARKALVAIRRGVPSPTQTAEQALRDIETVTGESK